MKQKLTIGILLKHIVLFTAGLVYITPFYIAMVNAFKTTEDIFNAPLAIPFKRLTLDNLLRNLNSSTFNVFRAYFITTMLVLITLILVILTSSALSYILSRNRKGFFKAAYLLLLGGLLIPLQVVILPLIQILRTLHMMLTFQGLVLVYIAWYMPFITFVLTGYISTIPMQLDESARIDGAGPIVIFYKVILPLMKPALTSVVIFIVMWTWNDFVTPLIIFGSSNFYTITTGIYRAIGQYTQKWDDVFAILFYAITPLAILYLWLQKFIISGMTEGSIKA
jgi:raffinose/stachyose/melibiose transport system permease protein